MLYPIEHWLLNRNYLTKTEIQLPWGICDLIGVKPNLDRAATRLQESGKRTIGDFANAWVLMNLPSPSARRALSESDLAVKCSLILSGEQLAESLEDLVERRLAVKVSRHAM